MVPVEIALSTLRELNSVRITVDITGEQYTVKNHRSNRYWIRGSLQFCPNGRSPYARRDSFGSYLYGH
ncbi:hypothetical protein CDAR_597891 [Caerostris darwini]|uniref:Uncharacterized protein n=1 Tax=Caerostris darwini TaxID=1538125 RepID=A0AAV4QN32_9ARAC|nr:hypothetical protein CDAR_597891 [Caerostris darwini]